jgi:hypothetical protein
MKEMKIENLIGKKISSIKMEVKDFLYDGSIPLEESNSVIILESGEIFKIPFQYSQKIELDSDTTKNQVNLLLHEKHDKKRKSFVSNFFPKSQSKEEKLISQNIKMIKGKKIIGVYQYNEEDVLDKWIIEIETKYLISEISIAPKGTGHAGIWIFKSKDELSAKFGSSFQKIS